MKKVNNALSNLRVYYSMFQKNGRCETLHEAHILGFGVPNAKNLAYGTPATRGVQWVKDSTNPPRSNRPEAQQVDPKSMVGRFWVPF